MSKFKVGDLARTLWGKNGIVTHFDELGRPVLDRDVLKHSGWEDSELELISREVVHNDELDSTTLTRRDHFAMAALTGFVAQGCYDYQAMSQHSYELADAMEAARNKEGVE